jgi:arginine exporter protein ArgO
MEDSARESPSRVSWELSEAAIIVFYFWVSWLDPEVMIKTVVQMTYEDMYTNIL